MFLPHPHVKVSIVGSLRDREVACSASDRQGSNFESCVWRTVSSQSSHHPQEVLLAQFSLYVHKGGLKPDSFHFIGARTPRTCFRVRCGSRYTRFWGPIRTQQLRREYQSTVAGPPSYACVALRRRLDQMVFCVFWKPLWYLVIILLSCKNHVRRWIIMRSMILRRQLDSAIGL